MKVEYIARAVADLRKISADSLSYGEAVAQALEARIRRVIDRVARNP